MNLRLGSMAGLELEMPPGPKLSDQIVAPVRASIAISRPRSPCTYTRSFTPWGVVTSLRYTGDPSGASGRATLNSCLSWLTLPRLTVLSAVLFADLPASNANCGQSYLAAGPGAACALCGASAAVSTAAVPMASGDRLARDTPLLRPLVGLTRHRPGPRPPPRMDNDGP